MSGKPRKKPKESYATFYKRLGKWQAGEVRREIREIKPYPVEEEATVAPVLELKPIPRCNTCSMWVPYDDPARGQCSRDPEWRTTNNTHYCGSWRGRKW